MFPISLQFIDTQEIRIGIQYNGQLTYYKYRKYVCVEDEIHLSKLPVCLEY